jgi:flagellar motility protein MotE (MotC chaperone)
MLMEVGVKKTKNNKVKQKKKKSRALRIIIPLVIVLIIIGGLAAALIFNLFSLQDMFFDTIYSLDPEYKAVDELRAELDRWEAELYEKEEKLLKNEQRLEKLKEELDKRKTELDEREIAIIPLYLRPLNEEELTNMKSIGMMYAKMAPEDAAEILASLYSIDDMAAILYYMPEKSSAAILAAMDTALAAQITDVLLHY